MASDATGVRGNARAEWLNTDREAAKILQGYLVKAEDAFRRRIQAEGLVLSGNMLNSFRQFATEQANGYVTARLDMAGYFRMKDLRSMNYARTPPIQAMEAFVEQVGVSRFARVPGYAPGERPSNDRIAVERIAWAIKVNRAKHPNVKRGYRGIYSSPLNQDVLPYLFRDLAEACNLTAMRGMKLLFSDQ